MIAGLGTVGMGCSVLEDLGTNPYEADYFQLYSVVSVPTTATPAAEPEVQANAHAAAYGAGEIAYRWRLGHFG